MSRYQFFDRSRLRLRPLTERQNDLNLSVIADLKRTDGPLPPKIHAAARAVLTARQNGAASIFMMGAHVVRSGVQRYLIDLMERGLIGALAGNGACAIHDFELARLGGTTESVARYLAEGQFGLWAELGEINAAYAQGAAEGLGAGEVLGRLINEETAKFPHQEISLLAAAYRLKIPFTLHMGIGSDIIHQLPGCDGAALGTVSYNDFLILAAVMERLENGFFGNFGSAVTGPEVFLKALAMVRNAAGSGGGPRRFTTLVCDLHNLPEDTGAEPGRDQTLYYYRPWKTLLSRSVAGGGHGLYVRGRHDQTIPALWTAIGEEENA